MAAIALLALPRPSFAQTPLSLTAIAPVQAAGSEEDRRCLALAVAYEAAREPLAGQQAVAEVVLNRLAHPAFPKSVCGVVFQGWRRTTGCQFTFTCDGSLRRRLSAATLAEARGVADSVIDGTVPAHVPGALNYHADYVRPVWAASLLRMTKFGAHIFYRPLEGRLPVGAALRDWSGEEPDQDTVTRAYGAGAFSRPAAVAGPVREKAAAQGRADGPFLPWGLSLRR